MEKEGAVKCITTLLYLFNIIIIIYLFRTCHILIKQYIKKQEINTALIIIIYTILINEN